MNKFNFLLNMMYVFIVYFLFRSSKKIQIKKNIDIEVFKKVGTDDIPKIIWIFWHNPDCPYLVEKCLINIKILHPNYQVNVLNFQTLNNYIDINFVELTKKMPLANLSDLIRLKLLNRYGGVWMDASIILNKSLDEFFIKNSYDLVAYYNFSQTVNGAVPVIESWLLAAPKGSKFIEKWLEIFSPVEKLGSKLYFEKFKEDPDYIELSSGLNNPEYLIAYLAARKVFKQFSDNSNLYLYPCDDSAYAVSNFSNWKTRKRLVNFYVKDKFIDSHIHKLTSGEREVFNLFNKFKLINSKSIIGEFLVRMPK